jgi:hypothetical protein
MPRPVSHPRHNPQALMALLHNKLYPDSSNRVRVYSCFARKQLRYMLGDSGRSYVVGVGSAPTPCRYHHRGSTCGTLQAPCDCTAFQNPDCNPNTLYGALVGGPGQDDSYGDQRYDFASTEVAIDYNAGFSGALAGLMQDPVTWDACKAAGLDTKIGTVSATTSGTARPASYQAVVMLGAAVLALLLAAAEWGI